MPKYEWVTKPPDQIFTWGSSTAVKYVKKEEEVKSDVKIEYNADKTPYMTWQDGKLYVMTNGGWFSYETLTKKGIFIQEKVIRKSLAFAVIQPGAKDVEVALKETGYTTVKIIPSLVSPQKIDWSRYTFVVFCGGTDIDPEWYGERALPTTEAPDERRDAWEFGLLKQNLSTSFKKIGICRGGQLLHIYAGGKLKQHITGHSGGSHDLLDKNGTIIKDCSSSHHQEMVKGPMEMSSEYFLTAPDGVVEGVWHPAYSSYCIQGHPEWGSKAYMEYFMDSVREKFKIPKGEE